MRRDTDSPVAAILVVLLTVAVVGGTGYAWSRYDDRVEAATDVESVVSPARPDIELPEAPGSPSPAPAEPTQSTYASPTFEPIIPTENRPKPVVLLVGDGWAQGDGASSAGTSYASLLARDLGWDIRIATEPGAGYTVPGAEGSTIPELYAAAPVGAIEPDAVLVQGAYAGATDNAAVARAIASLGDRIAADLPGVPLVAVSSFRPDGVSAKDEAMMTQAWRTVDGTLVLRPVKQGWADLPTGPAGNPLDAGHELIATSLEQAFRDAGLVGGG